jgi:peptide deformylase
MEKIKLRIHTWPERILRKKCKKIETLDEEIRQILEQMHALMLETKGVGLAANQVGLDLSLAVIQADDRVFKLVNPCIVKKEGKVSFTEGCLSFPDLELKIDRAKKIWVSSLNEKGEPLDLEIEGLLSVVFQHEIDHLNGIVFIDRVSFWQRLKALPKLRKIKRKTKDGLR